MRLSRELSLAFHPSRDELLISRSSRLPTRRSFERTVGKKGRVYAHIYIYLFLQATIPLITRLFSIVRVPHVVARKRIVYATRRVRIVNEVTRSVNV